MGDIGRPRELLRVVGSRLTTNQNGLCEVVRYRPRNLRCVVGSSGLEPPTSRLSGVCSNQLSYEPVFGGGKRVRTADPLLAGQVLYQLSYTPVSVLQKDFTQQNKCSA